MNSFIFIKFIIIQLLLCFHGMFVGTTVLNRHVPPSFMMANMTGTALYNTVFNSMGNQGETTPTTDDTKDNTQVSRTF